MQFNKVLALRGPNIWARFPVLEAWVDLGPLVDARSDLLPGFNARLMSWLPTLIEHRCSSGRRGGFVERLQEGTYPGHVLEHVALELQGLAGTEVGFGRTCETGTEGVCKIVVEYEEEDLGRACLESARRLCLAAIHDQAFEVAGEVEELRGLLERARPDPGTASLLEAARQARIPACRLTPEGLLLLGQGVRQRRFLAGQTDRTSAVAEAIASDRELTPALLQAVGVPTPPSGPGGSAGASPSRRLLVVGERVVAASDAAEPIHPDVAACAVEAAGVVGLDVAEIGVVADSLARPLEEQGGGIEAVDPHANLGSFGAAGAREVLEHLFPRGETGRIPIVAVTGVNGKTTTTRLISRMLARSGRCVGMTSTEGIYLFEPSDDKVTRWQGDKVTEETGAHPVTLSPCHPVTLSPCHSRGGRRLEAGDCSGPASAQAVLHNPRVEAAVLETARGGILRAGLGFDQCDVAVVTNIGAGDHLGMCDIDTPAQLARVKRNIVEVVAPSGTAVLKADDPLVVEMASYCPGGVVYFTRDPEHPVLVKHRQEGKRAVVVRWGWIVLVEGAGEVPLVPLEEVPLTGGGRVGFHVENALAAVAAAWSLNVPRRVIAATLKTFTADLDQAPARFNLLEVNGATAVFDYGHNADSLACLIEVLDQMPHVWRSVVYTAAGDRRDGDLIRQGELLGDGFDRVFLYEEEHCTRGKLPGQIIALFRQGLAGRRRVGQIDEVHGALNAIQTTLAAARPGDLVLVQVDLVDETIELVRQLLESGVAREIDFAEALRLAKAGAVPFSEKPVLEEVPGDRRKEVSHGIWAHWSLARTQHLGKLSGPGGGTAERQRGAPGRDAGLR
jgi:cyanophycin synthetase